MKKQAIKFGTSGHRGILGQDFTLKHVKAVTHAIAKYLKAQSNTPTCVIGCDPRPGNSPSLQADSYTQSIASILTDYGIKTFVFDDYAPTPLVSWVVKQQRLDGGIILTASHNPSEYNGIKFNPANGAPAGSEITTQLENDANNFFSNLPEISVSNKAEIVFINSNKEFIEDTIKNLEALTGISKEKLGSLSFPIDAKHGTVGKLWAEFLSFLNIKNYTILHKEAKEDFGGIEPNPTKIETLAGLKEVQKELKSPIAFANDPDGDRHVILDENGKDLAPEVTTTIIFDYLINKGVNLKGIASTVASSNILRRAAEDNHQEYEETAVGFKYFAPFLEAAEANKQIGLAVESSGGFTASFHVFEKCGFLPCLFMLFILVDTGLTVSQLVEKVQEKYGKYFFEETEYHFQPEAKDTLVNFLKNITEAEMKERVSKELKAIVRIDGVKGILTDGSWFLFRFSGTEPLARIYTESEKPELALELLEKAKALLLSA